MAENFVIVDIPVALRKKLRGATLRFLQAEFPARPDVPFAMIWYEDDGKKQEDALRLDLDKRIFLDRFADSRDQVLAEAAPKIANFVAAARAKKAAA